MKKKFKILACALLLIPCMFIFTGCKKTDTSISQIEYAKLLLESGKEYFKNYNNYEKFGDMKISSVYDYTDETTESFTYKENASDEEFVTKEYNIEYVDHLEQYVSIYNVGSGETADIYVEITQTENEIEKSYRVKDDDTLEYYEEKSVSSETYLLIKDGEDYKCFISKSSKEGNNEEEVSKTYYTYDTREDYIEEVNAILEDVNKNPILVGFYPSNDSEMSLITMLLDKDIYKNGNEFGASIELAQTSFEDDYEGLYLYEKMDTKFKDNKPSQMCVDMKMESNEGKMNVVGKINVSYSVQSISKPADTTSFDFDISEPSISILGMSIL